MGKSKLDGLYIILSCGIQKYTELKHTEYSKDCAVQEMVKEYSFILDFDKRTVKQSSTLQNERKAR